MLYENFTFYINFTFRLQTFLVALWIKWYNIDIYIG